MNSLYRKTLYVIILHSIAINPNLDQPLLIHDRRDKQLITLRIIFIKVSHMLLLLQYIRSGRSVAGRLRVVVMR